MSTTPLTDGFGRTHRSLRLSVTDRCNLRCRYCMPAEGMKWLPREELLTDDELVRMVSLFARMGISEIRVTGGEPLVRPGLPGLIGRITAVPGVREVAMTTNGVLLAGVVDDLVSSGLHRVNVSIDSLDPERFAMITRRNDLDRVLEGLRACERHPSLRPIKVNAVALRGAERAGRPAARRPGPPPPLRRALHRGHAPRRAARVDPRGGALGRGAPRDDRRPLAAPADGSRAGLGHGHELALRRRRRDAPVRLVGHRAVLRRAATACA